MERHYDDNNKKVILQVTNMNLINAYQLIQNVKILRTDDLTKCNLSVLRTDGFYFVFISPVNEGKSVAFVTEYTEDLDNLMKMYEFANSKGAIGYEYSPNWRQRLH